MADGKSSYKEFNDAAADVATLKGWIFIPIVLAVAGVAIAPALAAAGAASAAGASTAATVSSVANWQVFSQFYYPFFGNPATGAIGIEQGLQNIVNGVGALGAGVWDVTSGAVGGAISPDQSFIGGLSEAWNGPSSAPNLLQNMQFAR